MGQRRVLAHKLLGSIAIRATVIDKPVDQQTAKVLSLTENLLRADLDSRDVIDACTTLFHKYGNAKTVAAETGLPYATVLRHMKFDRLGASLQDAVQSGKASLKVALEVQDTIGDDADHQELQSLACCLEPLSGAKRAKALQIRADNPDMPVEQLLAEAGPQKIIVTLDQDDFRAVRAYGAARKLTQDAAAAVLIRKGLKGATPDDS